MSTVNSVPALFSYINNLNTFSYFNWDWGRNDLGHLILLNNEPIGLTPFLNNELLDLNFSYTSVIANKMKTSDVKFTIEPMFGNKFSLILNGMLLHSCLLYYSFVGVSTNLKLFDKKENVEVYSEDNMIVNSNGLVKSSTSKNIINAEGGDDNINIDIIELLPSFLLMLPHLAPSYYLTNYLFSTSVK
ncbi:hypothetical protein FACS189496_4460 [Bacilli bacterium]|nr:hypothetical protein FACS189496_4460 [Bacilli bacterium]